MEKENNLPEERILPVIALRGLTVFPEMVINFDLSRKKSIEAAKAAMAENQEVFLVTQKEYDTQDPALSDLYQDGTVAVIKQITKLPNRIMRV
ncbi:MAG: LON peptidase substrate-binding domain-containing protein, partial [Lachnospiraceae bacterium]|nr:LON peptidase substrate-binding domain-containing protein [Lachnospiraceae bacterium]